MEWEKRRAHVMQRMGIGSSSVGTRRPPQCSRGQYMVVLHCEGVNGTILMTNEVPRPNWFIGIVHTAGSGSLYRDRSESLSRIGCRQVLLDGEGRSLSVGWIGDARSGSYACEVRDDFAHHVGCNTFTIMEEADLSERAVITGCDHVCASLAGSPSDGVGKLLDGFWIRMGCRFGKGTMW